MIIHVLLPVREQSEGMTVAVDRHNMIELDQNAWRSKMHFTQTQVEVPLGDNFLSVRLVHRRCKKITLFTNLIAWTILPGGNPYNGVFLL